MALEFHGVFTREIPTGVRAPVRTRRAKAFIGTAPVHRAQNPAAAVNTPIVAYSYQEAVQQLGYSDDWSTWTLCEAIKSQFALFRVGPAVFINVFDPSNTEAGEAKYLSLRNARAELQNMLAIPESVVVFTEENGTECVLEEDYTLALSENGLTITALPGGLIIAVSSIFITYDIVMPASATSNSIIGGVDPATGERSGLEVIDDIFPKLRLLPDIIAAPGWMDDIRVPILLQAKTERLNSLFTTFCVIDIPESAGPSYRQMAAWKEQNGYSSRNSMVCWGKLGMGSDIYNMSTQMTGLMGLVDSRVGDVPSFSPSNNNLFMDRLLWNDKEVGLSVDQANHLNLNGIATALNWIGGWRAWGNRTASYPANTDPKDMWVPSRRMFNWIAAEIILTYWQKISLPIRGVMIDNIISTLNNRLAGLAAAGHLIGGRVEWDASRNPITDLIDGRITFHVLITPPPPAETIIFELEYDPMYLEALSASLAS